MRFIASLALSLLVTAAVVIASWDQGGFGDHVVPWLSIIGGIALVAVIASLLGRRLSARKNRKIPPTPSLKPWIPAGIFVIIVAASLAQVTHEDVIVGQRLRPHWGGEEPWLLSDGLRKKETASDYLPGTMDRAVSGQQLQLHVSILLIACALWMRLTRRGAFRILVLLVINGWLLSLAGIYFHFYDNGLLLGRFDPVNPRFFSAFRYHNHWGAFSLLTLAAGIGLAAFPGLKTGTRIAVVVLVGAFACTFLYAATLTQSRSLVVLLPGLVGLAVWQLVLITVFRPEARRRRKRLLVLGACVTTLLAAGSVVTGQKILESRAGHTSSEVQLWKEGRAPYRLLLARDSLKLVAVKPLWGWGLGCYRFAFNSVAGPEFIINERWHQERFYGARISTHAAHNDWLQYWSEIGTPGMVCLIATPWMLLRASRRSGRRNATSYWCFGGCALILVFALWDMPLSNPAVLLLTTVAFVLGAKLRIALVQEEKGVLICGEKAASSGANRSRSRT